MCVSIQNLALNAGRRCDTVRKHHAAYLDDPESNRSLTDQLNPELLVIAEAARQELYAAIRGLPPGQRQIVELRKLGELSVKQVARQLGIEKSAVTTG